MPDDWMERPKCWRPSPKLTRCCAFDPLSRTGRVRGLTFADGGYAGPKLRGAIEKIGRWTIQIVKRSDTAVGFELIPRRWVVERTFAWPERCRRMAKDWEKTIASAEAWLLIAHIRRVTRLLARQ